jgi:hypothetical protein
MAFLGFWTRTSLRRRWRAVVGMAVLLGLVGGLSLFALAGARRTQSAYPRFLAAKNPSTLAIDIGPLAGPGSGELARIAALPQVLAARAYTAFYTAPWTAEDGPDLSQEFETIGSIDGRYFVQDVFTPTKGRLPNPDRADEVAVNEEAARRNGYRVGQTLELGTFSREDVEQAESDEAIAATQPRLVTHATIVGVGAFVEEVLQDDTDRSPLVLFTPAFVKEAAGLELYAWQGLVLRDGDADLAAVQAAVVAGPSGGASMFRQTSIDVFHAQKATRPVALALGMFGLLTGVAAVVLVGQAVGRYLVSEREHGAVVRAMGARPGAVAIASATNPLLAIAGGVVLAGVVAVVMSPLMPVGRAGAFEVQTGIDVDWAVLLVGGLVMIVGLSAVTSFVAFREAPNRLRPRGLSRRPFGSLIAGTTDLSPSMSTGVRFAFDPGEGVHAVPVRSVMVGAVVAVAALVAAVTFGAGMDHLVDTPRLFGWDWDVALVDGAGYGNTNPAAAEEVLGGDQDVAAWSGAFYGSDSIDGDQLPLLGMDPDSAVTPPIRTGRMLAKEGEIVLGTETIRQLGKEIGEQVTSSYGPLTIVGTATFPTIGIVHGNHTSLGVGGIVITSQIPGWDRNVGENGDGSEPVPPEYGANVLFVRFRAGVDRAAATSRFEEVAPQLADYNGISVLPPQRSAEIVNTSEVTGSSAALGGAVAVAALVSLTVALAAVVVRRRRDLAILKSLGFTRRQVGAAVAWQASTTVLVGVVIGVPTGMVLGRVLWTRFADSLQVLAEPVTPVTVILLIAAAALAAANLIAVVPGRMARAVPSELALRSE